jgi:hypothetical protein
VVQLGPPQRIPRSDVYGTEPQGTQHPVTQVVVSSHRFGFVPQTARPASQVGVGTPPSVLVQLGSSVVLPRQSWHGPQVFMQLVCCVQTGHLAGSPKDAAVHVASSRIGWATPGTAQQPKQSHPFGVMAWQWSMHFWDWVVGQLWALGS